MKKLKQTNKHVQYQANTYTNKNYEVEKNPTQKTELPSSPIKSFYFLTFSFTLAEPLRHVYYDNFLGGTKISSSNLNSRRQRPHLRKVLSPAKIAKASFHKLADNSSNNTTPDDDIRNLTCKSLLN